jgi:hypothetical protein
VTDDLSHAVVVAVRLNHVVNDPLTLMRTKFPALQCCISSEILGSRQFVFLLSSVCQADDAVIVLQQVNRLQMDPDFIGTLRVEMQERYIWSVYKLNLMHEGHLRPMLPAHRGMFMSYEVTQEVSDMAAAGASPATIINYLTRCGKNGMITSSKVNNIRAAIASDISVYTVRPSSKESHCQSLLSMLDERRRQKKDVDFIFLYTDVDEEMLRSVADGYEDYVDFHSVRMQTGQGRDDGLYVGDEPPAPTSEGAAPSV